MSRTSREKGRRAELEAAAALPGAAKVSHAGESGHDLTWRGYRVEVKRRATPLSKTLERYLAGVDLVVTRHDGDTSWRAYLPVDTLLEMLNDADGWGFE